MPRPRYSRPKTRRDWRSIVRIAIIPTLALACVIALFVSEHTFQRDRQHWQTTVAAIEQARIQPIPGRPFEYGSHQLYEVDVLVTSPINGTPHQQWLPLSQPPKPQAEAQSQASTLKGTQCLLRWNPALPDETIAELR